MKIEERKVGRIVEWRIDSSGLFAPYLPCGDNGGR